jgi:hypothetical protein
MNRLACGGLVLLGVACSNGAPQGVAAPAATLNPSMAATVAGVVITPPTDLQAGVPAYFTFSVTGTPVNLTVAWGDGTAIEVGAVTSGVLAHVYASAGMHILTLTAKDVAGGVMAGSVSVFVK